MKTSKKAFGIAGACAIAVGMLTATIADAASPATGGTITFSGAIVSPSYGIASHVSENSKGFHTENYGNKNKSDIDVIFTPAPNTSPAAHVAVLVNTDAGVVAPRTLATRFVDSARHAVERAGAGYSLGRAGGTLSIAGGAPSERAVTVLVSYD
jgi:hypothetical protein